MKMNLPNQLTILRVLMIPVFVIFMMWDSLAYSNYIAAGVFILASITDFFDGYLARKYNLITNFGKFMDPLADKVLVSTALICFVADDTSLIPTWVVIIIMAREFIISGFRLVAAERGIVIAASFWAKIKTTVQMIMSIVLIFNFQSLPFRILSYVLIYAALLLTVISLVEYLYKNRKVLEDVS